MHMLRGQGDGTHKAVETLRQAAATAQVYVRMCATNLASQILASQVLVNCGHKVLSLYRS